MINIKPLTGKLYSPVITQEQWQAPPYRHSDRNGNPYRTLAGAKRKLKRGGSITKEKGIIEVYEYRLVETIEVTS